MVSDGVEGALAGARIRAEGVRAWAEGARAGAEHVSLLETGIRNSYAPEVHYTLTSHREARG